MLSPSAKTSSLIRQQNNRKLANKIENSNSTQNSDTFDHHSYL